MLDELQRTIAETSVVTSVTSSATVATLLAAETSITRRDSFMIYNDSTEVLYVKLGAGASTSDYSFQVAPNGFYEAPAGMIWRGEVTGIWASANGAAKVTELGD